MVYWVDVDKGGKKLLPLHTSYYAITNPLPGISGQICSWSLVLGMSMNEDMDGRRTGLGKACFLVEDAPDFLLTPGYTLKIYEGNRWVGIVEVIG